MGLTLQVGHLAYLQQNNDYEAVQDFAEKSEKLNTFLSSVNLTPHKEPEDCETFSCQMYGYSGLHYLRRIAAHLDLHSKLPAPGSQDPNYDDPSKDSAITEYCARLKEDYECDFQNSSRKALTFNHLLVHSDTGGYYLPQDFSMVLISPNSLGLAEMIGSSTRLREECIRLANALELPLTIEPDAKVLWKAANSQGQGKMKWQKYGIESFTCLRLYRAAEHSLKTGALIVFC